MTARDNEHRRKSQLHVLIFCREWLYLFCCSTSHTVQFPLSGLTEFLLENCDPVLRGYLESCLDYAWREINNGTVDEPIRCSYWNHWTDFSARWGICHYLTDCSPYKQSSILTSFVVGVHNGGFKRGHQITMQLVDRVLRAVGQTIQLTGLPDSTKIYSGCEQMIKL